MLALTEGNAPATPSELFTLLISKLLLAIRMSKLLLRVVSIAFLRVRTGCADPRNGTSARSRKYNFFIDNL
jgi:hypothetical protein